MQGHGSSVSTLPENLTFDHGSTSSDTSVDPQLSWTTMQTSADSYESYIMPSSDTIQYLHPEGLSGEWSLGESSSTPAQNLFQSEINRTPTWSLHSPTLEQRRYNPSNSILPLDGVGANTDGNPTSNRSTRLQLPAPVALPQDLNMQGNGDDDDDCRVVERPNTYVSNSVSSSEPFVNPYGGYNNVEESGDRPGCSSLDGQRISCKRKALEANVGQSSGCFHHAERSQWNGVPPPSSQIAASNIGVVLENEGGSERLRLGVGGSGVSINNPSLTAPAVRGEGSRRNFRLRINGSHQQDHAAPPFYPFSVGGDSVNLDVPTSSQSRHSSRLVLRNRLFDLNPPPPPPPLPSAVVESESPNLSARLHVPRRSSQSRWGGASSSSSRPSGSSSSSDVERDVMLYEESISRSIPRSVSEHHLPVFVPASGEMGSSSSSSQQQPMNWNLVGNNGNIASTSGPGSSPGVSSSWSHRNSPQYPRRLSELVRRSLLSAGSGGQNSNYGVRSSSSVEVAIPSGSGNSRGHHVSSSRSALLERHLDGVSAIPYSLRNLAAAGEGRSSIMSEQIRHVLDLMRRGEGLRFEDVMMLDHSVFFGMADVHDRHRDMRLDVDSMSYEELLALEERIGNVCTGLNEETITSHLKKQKYVGRKGDENLAETEPCSICREEYNEGEDLGTLECGHDFHKDCIKQWLMQKNLCPICKTTGLTT